MKKKLTVFAFVTALLVCFAAASAANAENGRSISDYNIALSQTEYVYNSENQLPSVSVTDNAGKALSDNAYSVSLPDASVEAGQYSVTVIGNAEEGISGSNTVKYNITPLALTDSNASVSLEYSTAIFKGGSYTPAVTVTVSGVTLDSTTDYTVSYQNNTDCGTAKAVITGKGNYSGTLTAEFKIIPDKTAYLISAKATQSSIELNWAPVKGADGYCIYKFNNSTKRYEKYKVIEGGKTYYNADNLAYATEYIFKVRAYYADSSKICEGPFSEARYCYTSVPAYNSGIKIERPLGANYADITYGRYKYCDGYQIAYSLDPTMQTCVYYTENDDVSLNSKRLTGLATARNYYVKIRMYVDVNGKRIYGDWGTVVGDGNTAFVGGVSVSKDAYSTRMTVDFDRQYYGDGYQVMYSPSSTFSYDVNSYYVNGRTNDYLTLSGLPSNKGYFVKVRSYSSINGKIYYNSWSGVANTGFKYLYESYSSNYVNNENRTTNLRIASNAINGVTINPGETFDFNKIVGPRTAAKGYKEATVFTGTQGTAQELGGGICQVASTIFNTALYGNVKITERYQHSQKVSYVPLGRDAAISGNSKNFRWTNDKDFHIRVYMSVSNGVISCSFYTVSEQDPGNIQLKVTKSGNKYTLKRYVNGTVNYTTTSTY